ncbi:MAG: putative lipid II flippase FtsW [Acidimicrobiales bacterium]
MVDVIRKGRTRDHTSAEPGSDSGWMLLIAVVALLCVIGLMMVLSASSVESLHSRGQAWFVFARQSLWVALGAVALAGGAVVDYRHMRRVVRPLLGATFALLLLVLVPGVGITVSGSTRWLGTEAFRFQPSELAKLAVLVFAADLLVRRVDQLDDARASLRPVLVVTGLVGALILAQPDMGTAVVLVAAVLAVLFASGVSLGPMLVAGLGTIALAGVVGMGAGYRRARLMSFLRPFDDVGNSGYQVAQSLVALGTGHLTGVGLGAGRAKWGFLPNAHTDFIFAILGEELGLLGTLLVVALFVAFTVLGVRTALRAPDRFGCLLATGITAWVTGQALVNMGAVSGALPVTGVPLPFVSFGGSSLVVTMGAVGLLVNVSRQAAKPRPVASASAAVGGRR